MKIIEETIEFIKQAQLSLGGGLFHVILTIPRGHAL
jgi:hypothetical protein